MDITDDANTNSMQRLTIVGEDNNNNNNNNNSSRENLE